MKKLILIITLFIFPSSAYSGDWIEVAGGVFEVDIVHSEIENALWSYLNKTTEVTFSPRANYTYQYQAISKNILRINAMCDVDETGGLNKEFVIIFDGGPCYFNVKYNLKTGEFTELFINGEA